MKALNEIIKYLPVFTGAAAVFIPFLIWYLNKADRRDDLYNTDRFNKRLDLLKRLSELTNEHELTELSEKNRTLLSEEINAAFHFFTIQAEQHSREKDRDFHLLAGPQGSESSGKRVGFWNIIKRLFLLYRPATFVVFVLQILFWVMGLLILVVVAVTIYPDSSSGKSDLLLTSFIILIIFFLLAALLNWNANKFQDRKHFAQMVKK